VSSFITNNPLSANVVTRACATNDVSNCWGYVDPLSNGDAIPCQHISHDNSAGNGRDYSRALDKARQLAATMTDPESRKGQRL
jgi:phage anti-repressor protein